jgi:hypothetical protein
LNIFVQSSDVVRLIVVANRYNKLPSQIVGIEDEYTAFCLDEACSYIYSKLEEGKEARWLDKEEEERKDGLSYLLDLQSTLL